MRTWNIQGPPRISAGNVRKVNTWYPQRAEERARISPPEMVPSPDSPPIRIVTSFAIECPLRKSFDRASCIAYSLLARPINLGQICSSFWFYLIPCQALQGNRVKLNLAHNCCYYSTLRMNRVSTFRNYGKLPIFRPCVIAPAQISADSTAEPAKRAKIALFPCATRCATIGPSNKGP